MFAIEVASLEPGLHSFEHEPKASDLDLDSEKFKDVHVRTRLDVSEHRILVLLEADATATLECDRTLRLFDQEISGFYSVLFAEQEFAAQEDDAIDEVRPFDPSDPKLELTDVVRDTILLAVPQRKVAPGAEEEEIPTRFGEPEDEEDIDPRWSALKELKSGAKSN